jgi:hypothetical protein
VTNEQAAPSVGPAATSLAVSDEDASAAALESASVLSNVSVGSEAAASPEATASRDGTASPEATASPDAAAPEATSWADLLQRLKVKRPAMAASLSAAEVVGEDGGYLLIRLPAENARFAATTLESAENRPIVLAAMREAFGRPLGLRIQPGAAGAPTASPMTPPPSNAAAGSASPRGRSNLADIQRIAEQMDGEILGPS